MGDTQTMTDKLMSVDMANRGFSERYCRVDCRTRAFLEDFYQCQVPRHDCKYAVPLGTSYLCMSPNSHEYLL